MTRPDRPPLPAPAAETEPAPAAETEPAPGAGGEVSAQDLLSHLDDAIEEMRAFMQGWHRSIVCGKPPGKGLTAENAHDASRFGTWTAAHAEAGLVRQPAFQELIRSHRQVYEHARRLALGVTAGKAIRTVEYDALINQLSRFYDQSRRLRDAFRKLVSEIDPLTGLHNRQVMTEELDAEYSRGKRTSGPLCLALADIDYFKKVNDTHGHAVGDVVLASVAGRFLAHLRPYDSIYRYGGEEFLLCLPNANTGTANSVLERLRRALESEPIGLPEGRELPVTASFGLVRVNYDHALKVSIERADQALYAAKQAGRNRVVTWSESLEPDA